MTSPDQTPEPDREKRAANQDEAEAALRFESVERVALPHVFADSYAAIVPPFEQYCRERGSIDRVTPDDIAMAELFRRNSVGMFKPEEEKDPTVAARSLAAAAVIEWEGRRRVVAATEFYSEVTGHSAIPIGLVTDEEVRTRNVGFWHLPNSEEFEAPAAVISRFRLEDNLVEVDPIFSSGALREAVAHTKAVSVQVSREARRGAAFVSSIRSGSIIFAMFCDKLQRSHESADREVPKVEGPLAGDYRAREELSQGPILGIKSFAYQRAVGEHELGVVTLDTRSASHAEALLTPSGVVASLPLVDKVYRIQHGVGAALLDEPLIKSVWIGKHRGAG